MATTFIPEQVGAMSNELLAADQSIIQGVSLDGDNATPTFVGTGIDVVVNDSAQSQLYFVSEVYNTSDTPGWVA